MGLARHVVRILHLGLRVGAILAVLTGCTCWGDPGIELKPPGWKKMGWYGQWGDLEISFDGIGNLVGCRSADAMIIVRNRSSHACLLKEAELVARGKSYRGTLNHRGDPIRVAPEFYERCELSWEFEDVLAHVFAEGGVLLLRFESEGKSQEIRLELKTFP